MKWMRYTHAGVEGFGLLDGDAVQLHEGDMFQQPRPTGARLPLADIAWLAPCRPGKIIGLWNNYRAAAEKNGWARPAEPLYFLKASSSVTAHLATIPAPFAHDGRVVYEGELAIVIGRTTRTVAPADPVRHLAGRLADEAGHGGRGGDRRHRHAAQHLRSAGCGLRPVSRSVRQTGEPAAVSWVARPACRFAAPGFGPAGW